MDGVFQHRAPALISCLKLFIDWKEINRSTAATPDNSISMDESVRQAI